MSSVFPQRDSPHEGLSIGDLHSMVLSYSTEWRVCEPLRDLLFLLLSETLVGVEVASYC